MATGIQGWPWGRDEEGGLSSKGGEDDTTTKGGGFSGGRRPAEMQVMARRHQRKNVRAKELTRFGVASFRPDSYD